MCLSPFNLEAQMDNIKKFSPALFGLIIFCFFLPFVNLSCSGQTIMSLTGFQLMTGAEVEAGDMFGGFDMSEQEKTESENVDPQPMAILAFIMALVGLGLSFIGKKASAITTAVISVLGFLFLILLKVNMDGDVDLSGQYIITLDYQFGYWFSMILFIAGAFIAWKIYSEPPFDASVISDTTPPDVNTNMN